MNFRVTLKVGGSVVVDADRYVVDDEVFLFATAAGESVASFPISNVLSVVKEKK